MNRVSAVSRGSARQHGASGRNPTPNLSAEFKEFSRKQLLHYQKMFKRYDLNDDAFIDVDDLSKVSVKLALADHLAADAVSMIAEVDEDRDGRLNLREFLLIFRKGNNGVLRHPGLAEIYRQLFMADGDVQENANIALKDFKEQIDDWSRAGAK